ncbi:hypothetical protein LOD99_9523 [Oopsacas minuta]|uniref:Transposase n=1 Tax=Oopsacas minuta TaxID=111878 RepID=A0AAV7JBN0_9METZ|nr:hypothetical protein LOD99_9523 [Oopsacas minuta]
MVWAGVSSVGRTSLVFVPAGVKIYVATLKELILQPIVKDLGEMMFENQPFILQQDGAPAHTANNTQDWLETIFLTLSQRSLSDVPGNKKKEEHTQGYTQDNHPRHYWVTQVSDLVDLQMVPVEGYMYILNCQDCFSSHEHSNQDNARGSRLPLNILEHDPPSPTNR